MKVIPERRFINEELYQAVLDKCGRVCVKCGTSKHLEVDHIVSVVDGGKTELDNLQILCKRCNVGKREDNKGSNSKPSEDKLTNKQEAFCREYVVDYNGLQAAVRAGYSETSAAEMACVNLMKHNVKAYIARLEDERDIKKRVTVEYILAGLRYEAEHAERPADRIRARELLGKYLKMFTDMIDVSGTAKIIKEEIHHKEE